MHHADEIDGRLMIGHDYARPVLRQSFGIVDPVGHAEQAQDGIEYNRCSTDIRSVTWSNEEERRSEQSHEHHRANVQRVPQLVELLLVEDVVREEVDEQNEANQRSK